MHLSSLVLLPLKPDAHALLFLPLLSPKATCSDLQAMVVSHVVLPFFDGVLWLPLQSPGQACGPRGRPLVHCCG